MPLRTYTFTDSKTFNWIRSWTSDYTFSQLYSMGNSSYDPGSAHTNWVAQNIPPFSKINNVKMGINNFVASDWDGASYNWKMGLKIQSSKYVQDEENGTTSTSTTTDALGVITIPPENTSKFNMSTSIKDDFTRKSVQHIFSSETENAGLIRDYTQHGYEDYDVYRTYFYISFTGWSDRHLSATCEDIWAEYDITLPTISLLSNDINMGSISFNSGTNITRADNVYTMDVNGTYTVTAQAKPGYCFYKWADGSTEKTRTFTTAKHVTALNTTYTAIFVPYYTIEYKPNDGTGHESMPRYYTSESGALDNNFVPTGMTSIKLPENMSRLGYTFLGWSTPEDQIPQKKREINLGDSGNKVFIANWSVNIYKIYLDVVPSTAFDDPCNLQIYRAGYNNTWGKGVFVEIPYDENIISIETINERPDKWLLDRIEFYEVNTNGVEQRLIKEFKTPEDINNLLNYGTSNSNFHIREAFHVKYKAIFKLQKYTITPQPSLSKGAYFEFDKGLQTDSQKNEGYDYGTKVTISVFPKYGYKFMGWNDDNNTIQSVKTFEITRTLNPIAILEEIDLNDKPSDLETSDSIIQKTIEEYSEMSIKGFGDYSFYNCNELKFVEAAPSSGDLKFERFFYIGDHAFEGCKNLVSVKLPDSCNSLGEAAFKNCENLTTLIIPGRDSKLKFPWDPYGTNSPFFGTKITGEEDSNSNFGRIFVHPNTYDFYTGQTSEDSGNWIEFAPFIRKIDDYKDICGLEEE